MTDPIGFTTRAYSPPARPETDGERAARIAREAEIIAEGERELDAGLGIEDEALEAWLDELDRSPDAPLPVPEPGLR